MFEPNELRDVLAVARARSLGAGAKRLQVDASTMGRRLSSLEARLGFALFVRRRDGFEPTPQGRKVIEAAEDLESRQEALERDLRGQDAALRGELRISAAEWGALLLTPLLGELARVAPKLSVTLSIDNRVVDLTKGEADIALRVGRPTERALVAKRIGVIKYGVFGSVDCLSRRGIPEREEDLDGHEFCVLQGPPLRLPHIGLQARLTRSRRVALHTNSMLALIEATRCSTGLAVLPLVLAQRAGLRRVLAETAGAQNSLWLVFHEAMRGSKVVRSGAEYLSAHLAELFIEESER